MFWAHDNRTYSRLEAFYGRDEAGKWGHFATSPPYNCRRDHPLSETLIIRETMPTFQQAQWTISGILLFTMQVLCVSCIICVDIVMFSMWQLSFINITWLERTVNIPGELKIRRSVTQALTLLLETNLCRKFLKRWTHMESTVWMSIVLLAILAWIDDPVWGYDFLFKCLQVWIPLFNLETQMIRILCPNLPSKL